MQGQIFHDIVPPQKKAGISPEKKQVRRAAKKQGFSKLNPLLSIFKKPIPKLLVFLVIIALGVNGLSSIIKTTAYYSDVEESKANDFTAGTLDFELSSAQVFSNMILSPGSSVTGTISVINLDNVPKYKVNATSFSGGLCQYLDLKASLNGVDVGYTGKLINFDYGEVVFATPTDWLFTLTLPGSVATDTVIGENCNFNFVFYGSQVRNNLPFGQGFNDTEDATSNVKAKMCFDSQTRSCGYWKNHSETYKPYLPQKLGDEVIDTAAKANSILQAACGSCGCGCNKTMRAKLKGQLLTMKFNVAQYGMGEYVPNGTTSNVNQIIAAADDLLKQNPSPPDSVLEVMKDLLDSLNQDLQIRVCTETGVRVLIPNGGEKWWVGKYYDLTWITKNLGCPDGLSYITIWYSADSGNTWGNITTSTENDGVFNWRIPLYLEHNNYYVPSDKARIKVVAGCSENMMIAGWDISDYDFCPPIDASLLTPEELEQAIALGLIEPPAPAESSTTEPILSETATDTATTTGENMGSLTPAPETPAEPALETTAPEIIIPTEPTATTTDPTTTEPVIPPTEPVITEPAATTTDPTTTEQAIPPEEPVVAPTEPTTITEPVVPPADPAIAPETPSDGGGSPPPAEAPTEAPI